MPQHLMPQKLSTATQLTRQHTTTPKHLMPPNPTAPKHLTPPNPTTPKHLMPPNPTTPKHLTPPNPTKTILHMHLSPNTPPNPLTSQLRTARNTKEEFPLAAVQASILALGLRQVLRQALVRRAWRRLARLLLLVRANMMRGARERVVGKRKK